MKCFHFYLELSIEISNENMSHCSTKGKKYAMFVAARIKKKNFALQKSVWHCDAQ